MKAEKNMITTSDVMVGDWVRITIEGEQYPAVVNSIKLNTEEIGVSFLAAPGDWEDGDGYDEIEPIPLTDEILKSNGFEKKGHRYGIYDDYFDFEMYEYNDGTWLVSYHCCEMSLPDEQVLIFHVHQLQHFMRHCAIEKEIIIKKED